jgi:hypothetical protein
MCVHLVDPYCGGPAMIEGGKNAVVLDKVCGRLALPVAQCSDLDLSAMALHCHRTNPFHHCRPPRAMGKRGHRSHATRNRRRMRLRVGDTAQARKLHDARRLKDNWEIARDWAHNHARPPVVPFFSTTNPELSNHWVVDEPAKDAGYNTETVGICLWSMPTWPPRQPTTDDTS